MVRGPIVVVLLFSLLLVGECLGQTVVYGGTVTKLDWNSVVYDFGNPSPTFDSTCGHGCEGRGDSACVSSGGIPIRTIYATVNDGTKTYYAMNNIAVDAPLPAGVADLTFGVHVARGVVGSYMGNIDIGLSGGPVGFIVSETYLSGPTIPINIYNGSVLLPGGGLPMYEGSASYLLYVRIPPSTVSRSFYIFPVFNSVAALQSNWNPDNYYGTIAHEPYFYIAAVAGHSTECATDPSPETLPPVAPTTAPPTPAPSTEAPTTEAPTTEAPTTTPPPTTTVCVPQQCSLATCEQIIQDGCGNSIQCPRCPTGQCTNVGQSVSCNALSSGQALVANITGSTAVSVLSITFSLKGGNDPSLDINMLYAVNGSQKTLSDSFSLTNAKYVGALQALLNHSSNEISFTFPIAVSGLNITVLVDLTLSNVVLSTGKRQESLVGSADILLGLCFIKLPGKSGLAHGNGNGKNQHGLNNRIINAECDSSVVVAYGVSSGLSASSVDALLNSIEVSLSGSSTVLPIATVAVAFAAIVALL